MDVNFDGGYNVENLAVDIIWYYVLQSYGEELQCLEVSQIPFIRDQIFIVLTSYSDQEPGSQALNGRELHMNQRTAYSLRYLDKFPPTLA